MNPGIHALVQQGRAFELTTLCAFDAGLVGHDSDDQVDSALCQSTVQVNHILRASSCILLALWIQAQLVGEEKPVGAADAHTLAQISREQPAHTTLNAGGPFGQGCLA